MLIADISIRLLALNEFDKFLKPLLMPLMLYYLIERAAGKIYRNHLLLALGLIIAWIGDILLLNKEQLFLISGIGVFLITQIVYLVIFKSNVLRPLKQSITDNMTTVIIFGFILVFLLTLVFCFVDTPLTVLVTIYAIAVASTTLMSFLQNSHLNGYRLMTIGMSCFLVSDTLIGINLFIHKVPLAPLLIMGTYGIAQYMITEGVIRGTAESQISR